MKNNFTILFFLLFLAPCLLSLSPAFAEPQRIQIKSDETKAREEELKLAANSVNLAGIEDPDARQAIQKILTYLAPQAETVTR